MKFRAPRGTQDVLPSEQPVWAAVREAAAAVASTYGYARIDTPMFEDTGVYQRGVGEGTDIVEKEMYTFQDKGGASLTLRPEGTAGVVRAYIEHGLFKAPRPQKLYYLAPNFRYERPQAGRYRQHHQFGVEVFGEADASLDAEVIEVLWGFLSQLGLRGLSLQINSIGDAVCRPAYITCLKDYYAQHLHEVCDDDRVRFAKNPLRLLDCKVPSCQPIADQAPHTADHLCDACAQHFAALRHSLDVRGLDYAVNFRLVRGFDYYTRTAFEIWPAQAGGTATLGGGGRYDGLVEELGGPATPAVGFGTGIERIVALYKQAHGEVEASRLDVYVVAVTGEQRDDALRVATRLRSAGLRVAHDYGGRGLGAQFKAADATGAPLAVVLGPDELALGQATVRDLAGRRQEKQAVVPLDHLEAELLARLGAQSVAASTSAA
ncbi:MAG: histidine--tRNA ligase [Chloroflexota bacterium]